MIFVDIVPEASEAPEDKLEVNERRLERKRSLQTLCVVEPKPSPVKSEGTLEKEDVDKLAHLPTPRQWSRISGTNWGSLTTSLVVKPDHRPEPEKNEEKETVFLPVSQRSRISGTNWGSLSTSLVVKSPHGHARSSSLDATTTTVSSSGEEDGLYNHPISAKRRTQSMDATSTTVKYLETAEGIRQLNPSWEEDQRRKNAVMYPFVNRATALPVVSYDAQEDLFQSSSSSDEGLGDFEDDLEKFATQEEADFRRSCRKRYTIRPTKKHEDTVQDNELHWRMNSLQESLATFDDIDEITPVISEEFVVVDESEEKAAAQPQEEYTEEMRTSGWDIRLKRQLQQVLARYEVPGGMLNKLIDLQKFEVAEFIVDDSNDMNEFSDVQDPDKPRVAAVTHFLTRWEEARHRIIQMMEMIAYLPEAPVFCVRFLNRASVLEFKRNRRESPYRFHDRVKASLKQEFANEPQKEDTCPAFERIRESFLRHHRAGTNGVLRYFMSQGVPDGGDLSCHKIVQLLMYRNQPERNPFTFLSCTDQDEDTLWMKECEEVAPYCSEFDDYDDESREILRDQGEAFPYSYGLHLVGQLVAAFNPDDLDAMEESVPFTQPTLSNLLGYQVSKAEYNYYFGNFVNAQFKLWSSKEDFQKEFVNKLPDLFGKFYKAERSSDIVEVRIYRRRLKADTSNIARINERLEQSPKSPRSPSKKLRALKLFAQDSVSKMMRHNSLPKLFRENSITRLFAGSAKSDDVKTAKKRKDSEIEMNDSFNFKLESPRAKKDSVKSMNNSFNFKFASPKKKKDSVKALHESFNFDFSSPKRKKKDSLEKMHESFNGFGSESFRKKKPTLQAMHESFNFEPESPKKSKTRECRPSPKTVKQRLHRNRRLSA